jgi:hypothetical protein
MKAEQSRDYSSLAARSPTPGGRQESDWAEQKPYISMGSVALVQSPGIRGTAGCTKALFINGISRQGTTTVLQTACRLGGSAVGRTNCVNHTAGGNVALRNSGDTYDCLHR